MGHTHRGRRAYMNRLAALISPSLLAGPDPYPGQFILISATYLPARMKEPAVSFQNLMYFYRKSVRHIPEIRLHRRALIFNNFIIYLN